MHDPMHDPREARVDLRLVIPRRTFEPGAEG